ncbi:DUF5959 family protein [Promicromonospora aerolata]|uniref:DUF5959 family protein n=1 Tax=Promicromonospora aerolata TaxID=195749 RepID=A0ABW4VBK9_9MICO
MDKLTLASLPGPDSFVAELSFHSADRGSSGSFQQFHGEFQMRNGFIRAKDSIWADEEDVLAWQAVLDSLDLGQAAGWRMGERGLSLEFVPSDDTREVDYWVSAHSVTYPFVVPRFAVTLDDSWFDRAYRKLDRVLKEIG